MELKDNLKTSRRDSRDSLESPLPIVNSEVGKHLEHIRRLKIFKNLIESPVAFRSVVKSTKQPQSIRSIVTQRLVSSIESDPS